MQQARRGGLLIPGGKACCGMAAAMLLSCARDTAYLSTAQSSTRQAGHAQEPIHATTQAIRQGINSTALQCGMPQEDSQPCAQTAGELALEVTMALNNRSMATTAALY
jgi:hypothetical protein